MKNAFVLVVFSVAVAGLGCEKASNQPGAKEAPSPASKAPEVASPPASAVPSGVGGHGGPVVELGSSRLDSFDVRASRDAGAITPGGDAPIDVWIDGGVGEGVTAVRFWIGVEDAKGSVKAKADIEDGKWHTHAEIPSPLPAESKLWVEIEKEGGQKSRGSYELKQ